MKIKIQRDALLKLITPTQSLIEKRNVIPILSKILLQTDQENFNIFSTDQENSLQSFLSLKGQKGAICVDSRNFYEIIKELAPGEISLEKVNKKTELKIESKTAVFNLKGVKAEDFPVFPTLENPHFYSIQKDQLCKLIEQTSYCVSTDETRYHLNGVFCEKEQNSLRFVATDGHRLSYADQDGFSKFKLSEGIIIPRKGLYEIHKLLQSDTNEKIVRIAIHPPRILVGYSHFLLSVRLIEGKYPNYKQLLPKSSKVQAVVKKGNLSQALKRVSILSSLQSKNVHFKWIKEDKKLILTSHHPDLGNAREEVSLEKMNADMEIRFNARYFLESLNHIQDEEIIVEMNNSTSPGKIKGKSSQSISIIMPMKL